jgi:hypothetical protein
MRAFVIVALCALATTGCGTRRDLRVAIAPPATPAPPHGQLPLRPSPTEPDRLGAVLNVKSFGAVGDGVVDDTAAIRNAIAAFKAGLGTTLFFPGGTYRCTSQLEIDLSVAGAPASRAYAWLAGEGSNVSMLSFSGTVPVGVRVIGAARTGVNDGDHRFTMTGLGIQRGSLDYVGTGLVVSSMTAGEFNDVSLTGFDKGAVFTDVLFTVFRRYRVQYCREGHLMQPAVYSGANVVRFESSSFVANQDFGVKIFGSNVEFDSCTFEAQGLATGGYLPGYTATSLWYQGGPDGYGGLTVRNSYFEATKGAADIFIAASRTATYSLENNSFNRLDGDVYTISPIVLDDALLSPGAVPEQQVLLKGNGFLNGGTYVASAIRPKLDVRSRSGFAGWRISDLGGNVSLRSEADGYSPDPRTISEFREVVTTRSGSYVPVAEGATGTEGTATYVVRNGSYRRIGDVVFFTFQLELSSHTGTGTFKVSLPPIPPSDTGFAHTPVTVQWLGGEAAPGEAPMAIVDAAVSTSAGTGCVRFYVSRGRQLLDVTVPTNGARILVSGVYTAG